MNEDPYSRSSFHSASIMRRSVGVLIHYTLRPPLTMSTIPCQRSLLPRLPWTRRIILIRKRGRGKPVPTMPHLFQIEERGHLLRRAYILQGKYATANNYVGDVLVVSPV